MNNRTKHQSLVPWWVRKYANAGPYCNNRHVLPAWHGGLVENAMWHGGEAFLALFIPWLLIGLTASILAQKGMIEMEALESILFSPYFLILPTYLLVIPPVMRFLAYHWLARTWERITGERRPEKRWYVTFARDAEARRVLTDVARRVRNTEIEDTQFHVARDIAALRGFCAPDLRLRDLVK